MAVWIFGVSEPHLGVRILLECVAAGVVVAASVETEADASGPRAAEAGLGLKSWYIRKTISVLKRNHPAGILRWKGAHLVKLLHLLFSKFEIDRRQVLF